MAERIMAGIQVKKSLDEEQLHAQEDGLKDRHVQMIAIGGTIGVGLFLGSAMAIQKAGPGLVVSYAIGGLVMFFIMRALGELLLYRPVAGSFATYAEEFVGPWAGFITGWSYWFMWVVIGMAEITAVGVYVHYWFPEIPQWVPALITLPPIFCKLDHSEAVRRNRVLVCPDQGGHHRRNDSSWFDDHPVQIR
jgi:amino acid transporter, AAT family